MATLDDLINAWEPRLQKAFLDSIYQIRDQAQLDQMIRMLEAGDVDGVGMRKPGYLTGAHATVQCAQCHTSSNYNNLPTTCYNCHQADFTGTTNPAHVAAEEAQVCSSGDARLRQHGLVPHASDL